MPRIAIVEFCEKRKITHYRLAKLTGMDEKNLARLLKPGSNPRFDTLVRISKALKCKVRDLIKE